MKTTLLRTWLGWPCQCQLLPCQLLPCQLLPCRLPIAPRPAKCPPLKPGRPPLKLGRPPLKPGRPPLKPGRPPPPPRGAALRIGAANMAAKRQLRKSKSFELFIIDRFLHH